MDICQHCGMYMKPFRHWVDKTHAEMTCEFCGEVIARAEVGSKWEKVPSLKEPQSTPTN